MSRIFFLNFLINFFYQNSDFSLSFIINFSFDFAINFLLSNTLSFIINFLKVQIQNPYFFKNILFNVTSTAKVINDGKVHTWII